MIDIGVSIHINTNDCDGRSLVNHAALAAGRQGAARRPAAIVTPMGDIAAADERPVPHSSVVPAWRTAAGNIAAGATAGAAVEAGVVRLRTQTLQLMHGRAPAGGLAALSNLQNWQLR